MALQHWPPKPKPKPGGTGWSNRDRNAQRAFRKAVLTRDNGRCTNCGSTEDLRACHLTPLHMGGTYDLANGVARCRDCDLATDPHAR